MLLNEDDDILDLDDDMGRQEDYYLDGDLIELDDDMYDEEDEFYDELNVVPI